MIAKGELMGAEEQSAASGLNPDETLFWEAVEVIEKSKAISKGSEIIGLGLLATGSQLDKRLEEIERTRFPFYEGSEGWQPLTQEERDVYNVLWWAQNELDFAYSSLTGYKRTGCHFGAPVKADTF